MKFFGLVWKNAWRKKVRTMLTILSVLVAFVLFALLSGINRAFDQGFALQGAERLVVIDKISLINSLPLAYQARIQRIPGVARVSTQTWFEAYYQDPKMVLPMFPVVPDDYFSVYPELRLAPDRFEAWKKNRVGAVIGQDVADEYGWSVGDRIPIQSGIFPQKDGARAWEFVVEGIFDTTQRSAPTMLMLFQRDYFYEAAMFGDGTVGWFTVLLEPGADAAAVANEIDTEFANSPDQTETSTEIAFAASFAKQLGNIALIVRLILGAVFFTLLLVAGNTMAQSVRERISELAVLKTVGFRDATVLGIVLSESILIMLMGGIAGLALGWALATFVLAPMLAAFVPGIAVTPKIILFALAFMIGGGIAAGILPALQARRLSIVDALARG